MDCEAFESHAVAVFGFCKSNRCYRTLSSYWWCNHLPRVYSPARVLTTSCDYISMDISGGLLSSFVSFGRTFLGIIIKTYETYRRIVDRGRLGELFWIGLLLTIYFGIASIVKTAAFRPFLLTKEFMVLAGGAGVSFLLIVCTLWQITRFLGGKGNFRSFTLAWGYTLVPTFFWFLGTSLLYVIL